MGCDIHCWLEYREPEKPWQIQRRSPCSLCLGTGELDGPPAGRECYFCDGEGFSELAEEEDSYTDKDGKEVHFKRLRGGDCYHGRNYVLFTLLAGVRNYDEHVPMFEPRGVPTDCSPEYRRLVDDDSDGHSHSFLNLAEVEAIVLCAADPLDTEHSAEKIAERIKGEFWEGLVIQQMRPLAERLGPENVRIVFYFDN